MRHALFRGRQFILHIGVPSPPSRSQIASRTALVCELSCGKSEQWVSFRLARLTSAL